MRSAAVSGEALKKLRDFERKQGNMAIDVQAGFLRDGQGNKILQPLPFGPKVRLILMHLCSEAAVSYTHLTLPTSDLV